MKDETVAITATQINDSASAIKEISRAIKTYLGGKHIYLALTFFTPQYKPTIIKETLGITLKPKNIFAIQSPLLIFKDKTIQRGIVCCCFIKGTVSIKKIFIKNADAVTIEFIFRKSIMPFKERNRFLISSLGPQINVYNYLRGLELALGRNFKVFGAGFFKKYGAKNFVMLNNTIGEGLGSIIVEGNFNVDNIKLRGFIPLGKSFTITKIAPQKNRIIEIDNKPAASVYKKYLENNFELFKKTSIYSYYPLGIKINNSYRLINVIDILDDDSLLCIGNIKEKSNAHIMMATPESLLEEIKKASFNKRSISDCNLAIIINSLSRRKILKERADEEIAQVSRIFPDTTKVIGLYCDYQIFPCDYIRQFTIENHTLSMILLKYGHH